MKKIKILALVFIIILGLGGIILLRFGLSVWSLTYWWILLFSIWMIWTFRFDSRFSLWVGLSLFAVSAFIISIGLQGLGEIIMRLSLLSWMIGMVQSVAELRLKT